MLSEQQLLHSVTMHTQFARKVLMRVIGLLCLCLVLTTQHGWYDQLTHIFGNYGYAADACCAVAPVHLLHRPQASCLKHRSIYNVDARGRALMAVTDHTPSFFSTLSTSIPAAVVIIAVWHLCSDIEFDIEFSFHF